MAGTFQVLWGAEDGSLKKAEELQGTDGEPLILPAGEGDGAVTGKICTRPTAVDLNGDGHLDIVSGNFRGTFFVFEGQGAGKFAPDSTQLLAAGKPIQVDAHSDPFFVDWDADGDMDLVTGSMSKVQLSINDGSATEPKFSQLKTLVEATPGSTELVFGERGYEGPRSGLRVWVEDVNGDGRLDILMGDSVGLDYPADGMDEEKSREQHAKWSERWKALSDEQAKLRESNASEDDMDASYEAMGELYQERNKFLKTVSTGSVWVAYQKAPAGA